MADTLQLNSLFQTPPMMNPVGLPVYAHRTEAYDLRGSKAPKPIQLDSTTILTKATGRGQGLWTSVGRAPGRRLAGRLGFLKFAAQFVALTTGCFQVEHEI